MSSNLALKVERLSKCYEIYDKPSDRLKQFLLPRLQRFFRRDVRKYYREFWALRDISIEVRLGETLGIIGRNGSGKSTLLQLICGTLNPSFGSVKTDKRIAAMLELGSGFNHDFTGLENIYINAKLFGFSEEVIRARLKDILDFAGLDDFINQPLRTYSSGMVARLAFSVLVNLDPEILIIDEALSVGDAGFQLKCMLKIHEIQERGVTILFVSHDTASVIRLCDRVIVLDQGKILPGDQNPLNSVKLYEQITRNVSLPKKIPALDKKHSKFYHSELQGIEETRLGSREAEYMSIFFTGDDGKEKQVFEAGDEIEIVAIISSKKYFENVATGFTLKNRSGVDVWGDNNIFANTPICLKKGLGKLSYKFRLNLPAGEYFLYVGLADISVERIELDQRWPIRRLTIVSNRQTVGMVFSPANIFFQELI